MHIVYDICVRNVCCVCTLCMYVRMYVMYACTIVKYVYYVMYVCMQVMVVCAYVYVCMCLYVRVFVVVLYVCDVF